MRDARLPALGDQRGRRAEVQAKSYLMNSISW